ncbi:MAG TPA: hypothetical protein PLX71_06360 [Phycicoccus sp.]|nr:hypothetical protein [Phycicoccus sp.]
MTELPTPQAQRLRRPSWRDSRLIVGVLLVVLSTALGGYVIAHADDTVPMYAAQRTLVPGQALTQADVRRVDVRLGDGVAPYVSAARDIGSDRFVLRGVAEGELIPAAALGTRDQVHTQTVAIQVDTTSASMLVPGARVDVYVSRPTTGQPGTTGVTYAAPERVLQGVTVAALPDTGSVLGGVVSQRPVHLVIPSEGVQSLVADIDRGAKLTLIPTPGSIVRGAS